jgi:hypothetical protein
MKDALLRLYGLVLLAFAALPAQAVTLDFNCISNSSITDCNAGMAQLSVAVVDIGGGQVQFSFFNSGPAASSITDVYFDDGSLLGIAGLIDVDDGTGGDPGVDFSQGASPGNLPSGNNASPPFQTTAGFLADSNPAVQHNGVNPGEWLGIIFDLQSGMTFADVLTELGNGDLRIGIHVQGFASGGSESFINNPVPVPDAVWLFGSGLLGLAGVARRKRTA